MKYSWSDTIFIIGGQSMAPYDFIKKHQGMELKEVCEMNSWELVSYGELIQRGVDLETLIDIGWGFTMILNNKVKIAYLEGEEEAFTIAHEIGHLVHGHLEDNRTKVQGESVNVISEYEQAADRFAQELLGHS